MPDNIKQAPHYEDGRKYKPKDVIRDWGLNFNLGSAVKYLSRAGRKDDIIQDLKKAQEFIQFEIDAIAEERKIKSDYLIGDKTYLHTSKVVLAQQEDNINADNRC